MWQATECYIVNGRVYSHSRWIDGSLAVLCGNNNCRVAVQLICFQRAHDGADGSVDHLESGDHARAEAQVLLIPCLLLCNIHRLQHVDAGTAWDQNTESSVCMGIRLIMLPKVLCISIYRACTSSNAVLISEVRSFQKKCWIIHYWQFCTCRSEYCVQMQ